MMYDRDKNIKTLEEALQKPCKNRDMDQAVQGMENYSSTPGGPNDQPLSFWASWNLKDRPRRIALLLDDCQEEYRPYAGEILPNLKKLVDAFREAQSKSDGVRIMWSAWTRTFDDGIRNSMDRWYGSKGFRPEDPENAVYIFNGAPGMKPLSEIAPTEKEVSDGWFYHGKHLDMFWTFDENGNSYLDEKLKQAGVDTIVLVGLWTDECILSTAYAGNSRGYDVVVVEDSVATATSNHEIALKIVGSTMAKVLSTDEVLSYIKSDFITGEPGAVKGTQYPDGRKDN
ncbi:MULTISPECIES: cysteine hydrolase [unclassified Oceanispirochaeta]|uniref:cysteine hydrolase n=1 Tax=unclassified Oceanispirochaeta TaxID=2635722 RepID=UPI000E09CE0C|nr:MULTISPECIES: cysteine hydrolase [unclassified Oceanispirochaeta]MBF9016306.1 cysteine hydrolase [Oceanispirochaeta sp. M2]NPD72769.1 cysteine hydrolase [Oceanispirochaeta sp. M1]RDG31614.1 cysteine hydrolase [Oceanispirochaeta sp. M1]